MALNSKVKINKKQFIILGTSLLIAVFSIGLIIYCLTFLIKNINLILKTPINSGGEIHFNLSGAEKLFPNIPTSTSSTQ
ncbi:MAG: hypothetical protein ACP5RX_01960 [Minisyncoccia bacterium]